MLGFHMIRRCSILLINNYRNVISLRFFHNSNRITLTNGILLKNQDVSSIPFRNYAKGKDKKKDKGKGKVQINEAKLGEVINVESLKSDMEKILESLRHNYTKHVSLRSTAGSIESIQVKVDGKEHTLQEIAQIVRKNPKLIVVNMSVFPQAIPAAVQAISKSGLNLNPQQEGNTLYLPVPKVTKEHRQELLKNAKSLFIKCRDGIKDIQNKHTKSLKKNDALSKDVVHSTEEQILAVANTFIQQAEQIFQSKQTELTGGE